MIYNGTISKKLKFGVLCVLMVTILVIAAGCGEDTAKQTDADNPNVTTEATSDDKKASPTPGKEVKGVSPEFKKTMDAYEEFFDKYCAFMKKYSSSKDATSMLKDYTKFMTDYADYMNRMDELGKKKDLTAEEVAYYTEVTLRINKKLAEVAAVVK